MGKMDIKEYKCREVPAGQALWTARPGSRRILGKVPVNGVPAGILVANVPAKPGDPSPINIPIGLLGPNETLGEVTWAEVPRKLAVPGDVVYIYVGPAAVCEPQTALGRAAGWFVAHREFCMDNLYWPLKPDDFLWFCFEIPVANESSHKFAVYRKSILFIALATWLIKIDAFYRYGLLCYLEDESKWYCIFALIYATRAFLYVKENTPEARRLHCNIFLVTDYLYPLNIQRNDPVFSNKWIMFCHIAAFAYSFSSLAVRVQEWKRFTEISLSLGGTSLITSLVMFVDLLAVRFPIQLSMVLIFLIFHFCLRAFIAVIMYFIDIQGQFPNYFWDQIPGFSKANKGKFTFAELTIINSFLCWVVGLIRTLVSLWFRRCVESRRKPPAIPSIFL